MRSRARIVVAGKVQGVSFRYYTHQRAVSLGIKGWVRNLPNGKVECEFEGQKQAIEQLIEFCRVGPKWAKVTGLEVLWMEYSGKYSSFQVLF